MMYIIIGIACLVGDHRCCAVASKFRETAAKGQKYDFKTF